MKISFEPGATGITCATLTPSATWVARAVGATAELPAYPQDPSWGDEQVAIEDALFAAINADRVANGLPALERDPVLDLTARWKSSQCGWDEYLDHADHAPPVDRPFGDRFVDYGYVTRVGYEYAFGENLAYGFQDAASCEAAFMNDIGHRDNILNTSWLGVGVGVARTNASCAPGLHPVPPPGFMVFCQDYGSRPVSPAPPPPPPPPPVPASPQAGEHWRLKGKPHAPLLLILAKTTDAVVYYENTATRKTGHRGMTAFRLLYERVTP